MDEKQIYAIERPHKNLLKLYIIRMIISGPFSILTIPILYFRYQTMRYRFDEEGISMSWGFLFKREVNLTFARIQDIHLTSGFIQRWLGLADIQIQTASGSATAEMTIEGLLEYDEIRNFLYSKMRGMKDKPKRAAAQASAQSAEAVGLLREIHAEMKATREAMERGSKDV